MGRVIDFPQKENNQYTTGDGVIGVINIMAGIEMVSHGSVKWGVHIIGPDTILAAHDFEEAINKCKDINKSILTAISLKSFFNNPLPVVYANVFVWSEIQGNHDPENTDWDELC